MPLGTDKIIESIEALKKEAKRNTYNHGFPMFLSYEDWEIVLSALNTEPAIDPDSRVLRDDLEAVSGRLYQRLHREIKNRFDINLPGHATTDKVLEVLDVWATEELSRGEGRANNLKEVFRHHE
jgi:hypothetical protein